MNLNVRRRTGKITFRNGDVALDHSLSHPAHRFRHLLEVLLHHKLERVLRSANKLKLIKNLCSILINSIFQVFNKVTDRRQLFCFNFVKIATNRK